MRAIEIQMEHHPEFAAFSLDSLSKEHGKKLKDIALSAIRSKAMGTRTKSTVKDEKLKKKAGVFVTLKKAGELRGCIGYTHPVFELWNATQKAAVHAAFSDPRFSSIRKDELESLDVEISVLGPMELIKVQSPEDIASLKIGTEGLMVTSHDTSGLLLPQVATEFGMDALEFLEATCEKSGLPEDAWKDPRVSIYKFSARIF